MAMNERFVAAGLLTFVVGMRCYSAEPAPTADQLAFFEKKIRPVLATHCYKCHSAQATKVKGGMTLDNREGLRRGGESGPAFVPGQPAKSLLIQALHHNDSAPHMPPKDR